MPHEQTKTVYFFDELSDQAREKARNNWREHELDYDWLEFCYDDAVRVGALLGITISFTPGKNMKGEPTKGRPDIYFQGFCSQGDGACFDGTYRYAKGCKDAVKKECPKDGEIARIAEQLVKLQKDYGYQLTATMKHSGHYSHSRCMNVTVERVDYSDGNATDDDEETLTQLMRDFADWIYANLEHEYEWRMADEQIDESIRANEVEFTESGVAV